MINTEILDFEKMKGLIPAIIIDQTGKVLMLGFMNKDALKKTIKTGNVTFYSRTKQRLWTKGETSGNYLRLVDIKADCDKDTILVKVNPVGPACHIGTYTCFNEEKENNEIEFFNRLYALIVSRKNKLPEGSYTTKLFNSGINRIVQKVGEEAVETVIAAKNDDREEIINETSDLLYHLFVMLAEKNITLGDIASNLEKRSK